MTTPRSWNDLFTDPRFHWDNPDPGVAALAPQWAASGVRRVYDLGCGAGRHLAFLEAAGFETFGSDLSPNGLTACAQRLQEAGLPARLTLADMTRAPFVNCSFDAEISTNVLNHNTRARLQQAIDEAWRVLRPGGEFFLTVINPGDSRYGQGEEIEPDTFVLAEGVEAGIAHHFFSETDLADWVRAFTIVDLQRQQGDLGVMGWRDGEPRITRDGWAVRLRKP